MGWWQDKDGLLGDGPADLCDDGLEQLAAEHGKPSWQEFLDALDVALDSPVRLRATFRDGSPGLRSDPARAAAPLARTLDGIVRRIAAEYEERRDRPPTPAEIVATFRFCLGGRPEKAIRSDGPVAKLQELSLDAT